MLYALYKKRGGGDMSLGRLEPENITPVFGIIIFVSIIFVFLIDGFLLRTLGWLQSLIIEIVILIIVYLWTPKDEQGEASPKQKQDF